MLIGLPSRWIFVWYEDGTVKNVANSDRLTSDEAEYYKAKWDKEDRKVVRVTQEDRNGNILKTYDFK